MVIKTGHPQFYQHFTSDHNVVYLQFRTDNSFSTELIENIHSSYGRLCMGKRDIVDQYIEQIDKLYEDHKVLDRAQAIQQAIHLQIKYYLKILWD